MVREQLYVIYTPYDRGIKLLEGFSYGKNKDIALRNFFKENPNYKNQELYSINNVERVLIPRIKITLEQKVSC